MSLESAKTDDVLKQDILTLLGENRVMCVATLRSDGWPQATLVGYVHDDLMLYFAVATTSQKLSNIRRDPRISIAIGHDTKDRSRGLSMAAKVTEVTDLEEVARINGTLRERYPEQTIFAPRDASAALLKATPTVVSIIDLSKGPGHPQLVTLEVGTSVRAARDSVDSSSGYGPPPSRG